MINKNNQKILADIKNLLSLDDGSEENLGVNYPIKDFDNEFTIIQPITGNIRLIKFSNYEIQALCNLNVLLDILCVRCLKKVDQILHLKFTHFYKLDRIRQNKIDLLPAIKEEILLRLPLKPLCKKDCSGIKGYKVRKE